MVSLAHVLDRRRLSVLVLCAIAIALPPFARAQAPLEKVVFTDWGQIDDLRSAWVQDAMGVHHSAPFVNSLRLSPLRTGGYVPECGTTNDGYATSPADDNHKLNHAMLVGAFLHGKEVSFALQGCSYDRPRIIAVQVR